MYNKFINVLSLMILAFVTLAISQECSPYSNDVSCFNGKYAYRRRYNRNKSRFVPRQSGLAPYITQCTVSNSFAMTFDDGPFDFTNEVLDQLDNTPLGPVTTTFFINGQNYGCIYDYADTLTRAYQSGHQIALHSWSHPDMTTLSEEDIRFQITHLEDAVRKILGVVPAYFRLPYGYGSDDPTLMGILGEYGYTVIGWDTDSGDSVGYSLEQSKAVYDSIMDPPNPHIVLEHDARQETVEQLVPYAIQVVQNAGYNIMPVASCLGADQSTWYKEMGSPSPMDETWVC